MARCKSKSWFDCRHYRDRGITVCKRWEESFEAFYRDMGDRPEGRTLDRIDNDGIYEPSNCRWATRRQQANNRTVSVYITYKGQKLTVAQWSRRTNLNSSCIRARLKMGWSHIKTLETPSINEKYRELQEKRGLIKKRK